MTDKIKMVCVNLLEEGSTALRETDAIDLGNGMYKLLGTPHYDPEDEIWEFLPGSIVRAKPGKSFRGEDLMIAYELVSPPQI